MTEQAVAQVRFFHLNLTSPARTRLEEAEHYFLAGNYNEAIAAAQQAWRECPHEADVYRVIAYIHMARSEYQPAAQAAYQAVTLDGEHPASYATLSQVYLTFNMIALAGETLRVALQRFPDDASLLALAADHAFRLLMHNDGLAFAKRALQLNPDDGYAKALLGGYYLKQRWYEEAVPMLRAAAEAYPTRWDYQMDYGIALLRTRQADEAFHPLAAAYRGNPLHPTVKQHLFFAVKLRGEMPGWYWRNAWFFYGKSALATTLLITGVLLVLIGGFWGTAALVGNWGMSSFGQGLLLFVCGLLAVILTSAGVCMHMRTRGKIDRYLTRVLAE